MEKRNKIIVFWLMTGALLVFGMVMIGGITRLTHSGLSIVEWKLIMGAIPPMNELEWKQTFEKYQDFPEYKLINKDFALEEFKSIFWWEYIHRLLGRLIGLIFLLPFLFFLIKKWLDPPLVKKLSIMFLLGGFQGFLGWYMVKSGLADNPYVSHYRLAIHLITATILFGYILWVALAIWEKDEIPGIDVPAPIRRLSMGLLAFVLLQIIYGGFVAGLKAGLVYNTFPKMGEEWFPSAITTLEPLLDNFIIGLAGVQFLHRYFAYMVAILVLWIWMLVRKHKLNRVYMKAFNAVFLVLIIQFTLGVLTLINSVPISLAVMHQAMAMILVATIVYWLSLLYPNKSQSFL
ncbi:MAG TPA: heme A synthase [Flavobacteriales bacterium]|nr:heme A synthase [Flavobacteriales bacterium]HIN39018.1 heme A synthase [Flavobacteriales bacterium]